VTETKETEIMWRKSTVLLAGLTTVLLGGAGCGDGGGGSSTIRVRWDIAYLDGQATTCAAADTPNVGLVALNLDTGKPYPFKFACGTGFGVTDKVPTGFYKLTLSLLNRTDQEVAVVEFPQIETRRNGVTEPDLAPFDIQAWHLQWAVQIEPAAGGNARASRCEEVGGTDVELTWQLGGAAPQIVTFPCPRYEGISPAIGTGFYQAQVRLLAGTQELSSTGFMGKDVTDDPNSARVNIELAVRR
jgi:hypothetical protein